MTSEPQAAADAPTPRWPFIAAFVVGIVFLTVLPFLQKRFLKAPPPIRPLGAWSLDTVDEGTAFGSAALDGKVTLFSFAAGPCGAECVEAQAAFGRGLDHTDDLGEGVHFVTIARGDAVAALKAKAHGRWHIVTGTDERLTPVLATFHTAWAQRGGSDAGTTLDEQIRLPAFVVVDQLGQIRDFWRDDSAGRGNAINAARLLGKHGPMP